MRKTTINISSLNQDVKNQNEDFLRSMDGIIAVLDSIRQIGKNGSSYGLQNDLIELTNDLPHKLLAALDGKAEWSEGMKQAFLNAVQQGLPKPNADGALKKLDGNDFDYSSLTGNTSDQLDALQDALRNHITFSLNKTAEKHAELAATATLKEYDKIAGIVTGSGLTESIKEEVDATKAMFKKLAEHEAEFNVVSAHLAGAPQQHPAATQAGNQVVAILNEEKTALSNKLQSTKQKIEASIQSFQKDISAINVTTLPPVKAQLTQERRELADAITELEKAYIKRRREELIVENLPANDPRKDALESSNTQVVTVEAQIKAIQDKIKQTENEIADLVSKKELAQKQKETLDSTANEISILEQGLSQVSFVQVKSESDVTANQTMIATMAEIVTKSHKSAVEHAIFSNDTLVPKLVKNGIDVFAASRLFSVNDSGDREKVVEAFTNKINTVPAHNDHIKASADTDKARDDAVVEAVNTASNELKKTLNELVKDNKLDAIKVAQNDAIKAAADVIKATIDLGVTEQQEQLKQDILTKVKTYIDELSKVTDPKDITAIVGAYKQDIQNLVSGIGDTPGATNDTLKQVAEALYSDPKMLSVMKLLELDKTLENVKDNANDTNFNSFVGDIDPRFTAKLQIAALQAEDAIAAIKKATTLQEEAQKAPDTATVDPKLQQLSNDLPHTMEKILQWSRQYPKASAGSQSFF